MPRDSASRVLLVAVLLCVVCSVVVSAVAVGLREKQEYNSKLDEKSNILVAAGMIERGEKADLAKLFESVDARVVDLSTGRFDPKIDAAEFDPREAAKDPERSVEIPPEQDLAGIKRRATHAPVWIKRGPNGALETLVLPIHGKGLWSTMYGFVALGPDLKTVKGLVFHDHAETPGLGGEVDNPRWRGQWPGKELFDPDGAYHFDVLKGQITGATKEPEHKADGLSGATITTRGVDSTLKYWFGEGGFGPFLARLRNEEANDG